MTGRFPRSERLPSGADFQALFQHGKRIDRPSLIILWREAAGGRRVGFAVSRHVRGAVARNRARRRLREAYRATRDRGPAGMEAVIIGKRGALEATREALEAELGSALGAMGRGVTS